MKNLILLAALVLPLAAQAETKVKDINDYEPQGWEAVVLCGSGDSIGGMQLIRGASKKLYISISSQEDSLPATIYFTEGVKNNDRLLKNIRAGRMVSLVFQSDDSFAFGGSTTKSALLNIKAGKADTSGYNSVLAEKGDVINLNCVVKKGE